MKNSFVFPAILLWLCGFIQYAWLADYFLRLPEDYHEILYFATEGRFRTTPNAPWIESHLIGRRVEQALVGSSSHTIIQGNMHWTNNEGVAQFESTGIYGVDRYTRKNLPGYGNEKRASQFLFPLHVGKSPMKIWDPMFIGERTATYERTETLGGLEVSVFRIEGFQLDETSGYSHLLHVPEKYYALTDGSGLVWVEPTSGVVVDFEEKGTSYFTDPVTNKKVADLYIWQDRYTDETKARKLDEAYRARQRILMLEVIIPVLLLAAGFAMLGMGLIRRAWQKTDTRLAQAMTKESQQ